MIGLNDIVHVDLSREQFNQCVDFAKEILQNLVDRIDLHPRDDLERFNDILMGEVAEALEKEWFAENGKYCQSAVDKESGKPDLGHDLILQGKNNNKLKCSIKSSLSYKLSLEEILETCKIATKSSELRDVNIQIYFLLSLNPGKGKPRITVPSIKQSYIIGWFGSKDINAFNRYRNENREAPEITLNQARSLQSLLDFIS